jgi:protein-L-isoaspartate(D-aspartate) O-methyltransferase
MILNNNNKDTDYRVSRERMVEIQIACRGISNPSVLEVMRKIPRHKFVSESLVYQAYNDSPLPIGEGQTISQPYMVAAMTEHLALTPDCITLELGTGSGYQTAVLAELCKKVYSIERLPNISLKAGRILSDMGYNNVVLRIGDGTLGSPKDAPFNRIIVTAGAPDIPKTLLDQLSDGGIMVIPVGDRFCQALKIIRKSTEGVKISEGCYCTFVKLIGKYAYEE